MEPVSKAGNTSVTKTQISPTYVPDLVNAALDLLIDEEKGIWHIANTGEITWADLAKEIANRLYLNRKFINAVPQSTMNLPANRPNYSVLSSTRGIHLPSLDHALSRYCNEASVIDKALMSKTV